MAKGKVVYKVIRLGRRISFIVYSDSKYCIHYKLNTIVKSIKESLGIMCFETREYANIFIEDQCEISEGLGVIKVRPIGKASYPNKISHSISTSALYNFYKKGPHMSMMPPEGTVCYKSVEVLT